MQRASCALRLLVGKGWERKGTTGRNRVADPLDAFLDETQPHVQVLEVGSSGLAGASRRSERLELVLTQGTAVP